MKGARRHLKGEATSAVERGGLFSRWETRRLRQMTHFRIVVLVILPSQQLQRWRPFRPRLRLVKVFSGLAKTFFPGKNRSNFHMKEATLAQVLLNR